MSNNLPSIPPPSASRRHVAPVSFSGHSAFPPNNNAATQGGFLRSLGRYIILGVGVSMAFIAIDRVMGPRKVHVIEKGSYQPPNNKPKNQQSPEESHA